MSEVESPLRLQVFGRTDVGQIREHNEDNFLVANLSDHTRGLKDENRHPAIHNGGFLLGVCDGMGGAAAGEVASQLAVDLIYEQLTAGGPATNRDELARRLVQAIEYAGAHIFHEARADRSRRGMGTTATIAALLDRRLFVGQVGDSRAYLLRGGKLLQLTRDQSLVNQLIEAGQLTEEEAETFEHNNIILQALGTAETVQVDLTFVDVCQGDLLLLCSDGLSGMIRNDDIHAVLTHAPTPFDACRELTDRANAAGGHDNITVIVAKVESGVGAPGPDDTFGYQKYALPDPPADEAQPVKGLSFDTLPESYPAEETLREGRGLRVSHTMIGVMNPLADGGHSASARPVSTRPTPASEADTPRSGAPREPERSKDSPSTAPRRGNWGEEPVDLPTRGLPPPLLATLVVSGMVLAALLGYLALQ